MKNFMYIALACGVVLAAVASSAPSYAASSRCNTDIALAVCTTRAIPANAANRFVHVQVSPFQSWRVFDVDMRVQVANGSSGVFGVERTITGLTNHYNGSILNPVTSVIVGGHITISNT